MEYPNVLSQAFQANWADHLCEEFLDQCHLEGCDMVQVYPMLSCDMMTPEMSIEALVQILKDQEIDEDDFIISYDHDLGCFDIDPLALELELITA